MTVRERVKNSPIFLGKGVTDEPEDITYAAVISSCEKGQYLESLRNAEKKKRELSPVFSWDLPGFHSSRNKMCQICFWRWMFCWKD